MYVKIIPVIVLATTVVCEPRRVPKIYNAVITSSDNLEPSKAYPIIQPVIQPAAIAYQVHLPYIPNGDYHNYLHQHTHPELNTYTTNNGQEHTQNLEQIYHNHFSPNINSDSAIQNVPLQARNVLVNEFAKVAQQNVEHQQIKPEEYPVNLQSSQVSSLRIPQYQQPKVTEAKVILPQQPNYQVPQHVVPNYHNPEQPKNMLPPAIHQLAPDTNASPNYQAAQSSENVLPQPGQVTPNISYQNVNQARSAMPQFSNILNNHFRHRYPDIPDVPPPPLPTARRQVQEEPSAVVQQSASQ